MRTKTTAKTLLLTFVACCLSAAHVEACRLRLRVDPAGAAIMIERRGDSFALSRQYQQAVAEYSAAQLANPAIGRPYTTNQENIFANVDKTTLLAILDANIRKEPQDPYALAVRAALKVCLGDRAGAEIDYSRSIELKKDLLFTRQGRAENRIFGGLDKSPIEDLELALKLDTVDLEHRSARARIFLDHGIYCARQGHLVKALEEYGLASDLRPDWSRPLIMKAELLSDNNEHWAAKECLDEAIRLEPQLGIAYRKRAHEWRIFKYLDAALQDLSLAIIYEPELSDFKERASLEMEMGDYIGGTADWLKGNNVSGPAIAVGIAAFLGFILMAPMLAGMFAAKFGQQRDN